MTDPLVTIFTAPKPFTNPHIATIQRNAILSWQQLGPDVRVMMIGEEEGMAEFARQQRILHLPQVERNPLGTPLVSSIFSLARQNSTSPYLLYVNADIILLPDILGALWQVGGAAEQFLIVGQRWDLSITTPLEFTPSWQELLLADLKKRGKLHVPAGSDYFAFPRGCFTDMPKFAIGRAGWDNWVIYKSRLEGWPTIDATQSIRVIHQRHDYSHLPGGQPHYKLPETYQNVKLAGGRRTIFKLLDTDRRLINGKLTGPRLGWRKLWREVEIFPLLRLDAYWLTELLFTLFHPVRAYRQYQRRKQDSFAE